MSKRYDTALKQQIVYEYLEGKLGFEALAKKYDVSDHQMIREWLRRYELEGVDGLCRAMKKQHYSAEFKYRVITYRKQQELSYAETATVFGIINSSTICAWQRQYDTYGILGLEPKPRGSAMKDEKPITHTPLSNQEREELKELRIENERLRAAIAYEKKLQALAQREGRRIPRKRR
jgi:transposase